MQNVEVTQLRKKITLLENVKQMLFKQSRDLNAQIATVTYFVP